MQKFLFTYCDREKSAADNYTARTIVHMSDSAVKEMQAPDRKPSVRAQLEEARKSPAPPQRAVPKERKAGLEL